MAPMGEGELIQPTLYERPVLSVSELTLRIKQALEANVGHVWVSGEISGFKLHGESGHMYFRLKDESALLKAVMFRFQNRGLKFQPQDGMEVIAFGRISVFERNGEYQLYVEHMQPKGLGILQIRFEQLKQKLQAEGLFDESRKRPLPLLPEAVGIVTSKEGSALQDMVKTIHQRYPARIYVGDARVQGDGAAQEIARAIKDFPRQAPDVEVLIVGRGGGSIEDLWAFNEEVVVRAIAGSRIPVVSAVGHETDFTLADFVADVRAKTPTDAGTLVVPVKEDLELGLRRFREKLDGLLREEIGQGWLTLDRFRDSYGIRSVERLGETWRDRLGALSDRGERALAVGLRQRREAVGSLAGRAVMREAAQVLAPFLQRLERAAAAPAFTAPDRTIQLHRVRLAGLAERLEAQAAAAVQRARAAAVAAEHRLAGVDPLAVLQRGYSITTLDGKIVRDSAKVPPGVEILTRLHKGEIRSITRG